MWTHFEDFPRFFRYVKEVRELGDGRSQWVVDLLGRQEWTARNEEWIEERQIGWRTLEGDVTHSGRVHFEPVGADRTRVTVRIDYDPPGGLLGDLGDKLGGGSAFEAALQEDLENFAQMVGSAQPTELEHAGDNYLFHRSRGAA